MKVIINILMLVVLTVVTGYCTNIEDEVSKNSSVFEEILNNPSEAMKTIDVPPIKEINKIQLEDVTKQWTFYYNVISAFPELYSKIPQEENADILTVFHFYEDGIKDEYHQRRIEFFYTGGDWMSYGLVYFVTNAGKYSDQPEAYFMEELSTPDREGGTIAPKIDPFNDAELQNYILNEFLDSHGKVKETFKPLF